MAPNGERFNDVKAQQKKQWLEDLGTARADLQIKFVSLTNLPTTVINRVVMFYFPERQREEQRLRNEAERQKLKEENVHDTWADKMGGYKPQPLPRQVSYFCLQL